MITAVTRKNYPFLLDNLRIVEKWDARLNLSMYTAGRTGEKELLITSPEDLSAFRKIIDQLIEAKRNGACIFSSEAVLNRYYEFFANGSYMPNCQAGYRSLVVNPDGRLVPCAMQKRPANNQSDLINNFSRTNTCGGCYVSMRANTEKSVGLLFKDGLSVFRQKRRFAQKC